MYISDRASFGRSLGEKAEIMAPLLEGITALNTNNNRRIYRPISGGGEIS